MFLRHVRRHSAYFKCICVKNNPALDERSPFKPTVGPIQVRKREEVGEMREQASNTALLTLYIGTSGSLFCFCILVSTRVLTYVHYFYTGFTGASYQLFLLLFQPQFSVVAYKRFNLKFSMNQWNWRYFRTAQMLVYIKVSMELLFQVKLTSPEQE